MNRLIDSIFGLGVFLIPIAAIVIGGVIAVTKMILHHQERSQMIARGMDPDAPHRNPEAKLRIRFGCIPVSSTAGSCT